MKSFLLIGAASAALSLPVHADEKLEELVVTASRNEIPLRQVGASVSVLTEADIQLQVAQSLNDLLRNQPGITVSNSGGLGKDSALRIRGEEGYRTLVLIDGVELTDPTGTQAMSHVEHLNLANDIERIEILRGPQGFVYGADAGGVINIFTRSVNDGLGGAAALEAGSYNTQRLNASLSGGTKSADGFISVARLSSDGFNARESDTTGEQDGYDNTSVHAKGGVNFTKSLRAQLVVRDQSAENEYDNCAGSDDCESNFDQLIGRFLLDYDTEKLQQSVAYSASTIERLFFTQGVESYAISGGLSKAEYFGRFTFSPAFTGIWGADYKEETIDGDNGEPDTNRDQLGLFAELQAKASKSVFFTGGLRHDDNEDFGAHSSYRVTAAWLPINHNERTLKLRSSLGSGFRAPSLSELAYNRGPWAYGDATEVQLKAETSEGFDLGLDYYQVINGRQSLAFEITLFSQKVENEIYFDLVDYTGYLQAAGESTSHGSELVIDFAANQYIDIILSSTWNPTETRDDEQRVRRPENSDNLGLQLNLLNNTLKILANIYSARNAIDIDGSSLDDYTLLSLSANWQLQNFLLTAKIDNLADHEYQQVSAYNTAGRSVFAGIQYSF